MNSNPVSELLSRLISSNLSVSDDRKAKLHSYYTRILGTSFADEFDSGPNVQLKLATAAEKNRDKVLRCFTNLMNKRSVSDKLGVIKFLIKASEQNRQSSDSSNFLSNFTTRGSANASDVRTIARAPNDSSLFGKLGLSSQLTNRSQALAAPLNNNVSDQNKNGVQQESYQHLFSSLVSTFQGFQTEMFSYDPKVEMFVLRPKFEDQLPLSVIKLLYRLNELGWLYYKIDDLLNNMKRRQMGLTVQSLLAAVQTELTEYYNFLVTLTNIRRTLNLTSPNFLTTCVVLSEEQFSKLRTIGCVLEYAFNLTPSEILSLLFVMSQQSFMARQMYLSRIFESSSRSLMEFINTWVITGNIVDPASEFFIKINTSGSQSDKYWKEGLQFSESRIPSFIDAQTAESIFTAGKIIRLIKRFLSDYVQERPRPIQLHEVVFSNDNSGVRSRLGKIFEAHNKILMDHIHRVQRLDSSLLFLRDLYFTHRGDFCFQFIEGLDAKVHLRTLPTVSKSDLLSALESAFKSSFEPSKPVVSELSVEFVEKSLNLVAISTEDVFEYFVTFEIKVPHFPLPLNNVLSSEVLKKYQLVMRYLLTFKVIRFQLSKFWNTLSKHKYEQKEQIFLLSGICALVLNKMTRFIDGLLSYWIYDVIERNWKTMFEESVNCTDFPRLIQLQSEFIDGVIEEITFKPSARTTEFLTKQRDTYNYSLHSILKLINAFIMSQETIFEKIKSNLRSAEQSSFDSIDRIENKDLEKFIVFNEQEVRKVQARIRKIDENFCKAAIQLMDLLRNKNIANKLDFNNWYTNFKENIN